MKLPERFQMLPRKTLPPSSGNAGNRLKTPKIAFIRAPYPSVAVTATGAFARPANTRGAQHAGDEKAHERPRRGHTDLQAGILRLLRHL